VTERQLDLVVQARMEMFADRPGMLFAEAVIEAFVVGIIETLLLERAIGSSAEWASAWSRPVAGNSQIEWRCATQCWRSTASVRGGSGT
jgi:hypothetical protein